MVWLVHYSDILYILYHCYRGTEKQAVAYDYAMRLSRGNYECQVLKITWGMCIQCRHLLQIHVSNLESKFELPVDWHFTGNFVVLCYGFFFWSRKLSMMPTKNCFPNRKRCHQIRCFVICWTSACVRLQRTTNRCGQWRGRFIKENNNTKQVWKRKPLNQIII